jgi:hydroxymethylpyrimidine pyrophosphatase-like HAD family hydrolase
MTMSRNVMMFKRPDFGVAMGNAGDRLKRRARAVNDCCDDGGFGEAVERCVLDSGTQSR